MVSSVEKTINVLLVTKMIVIELKSVLKRVTVELRSLITFLSIITMKLIFVLLCRY